MISRAKHCIFYGNSTLLYDIILQVFSDAFLLSGKLSDATFSSNWDKNVNHGVSRKYE